jgi:hypothetical protein
MPASFRVPSIGENLVSRSRIRRRLEEAVHHVGEVARNLLDEGRVR